MGFRFRRSIKIAPGVRLNFSRSGVSTSIGARGAHVTIGHGKVRETVGIPGTGISYTEQHRTGHAAVEPRRQPGAGDRIAGTILLVILLVIVFVIAYACGTAIR